MLPEANNRSWNGWNRLGLIAAATTSLALFVYLLIRAANVPFAHDEAATFFFYIQTGKFIPGLHYYDANNHFLNSILTWVSYILFGSSKLALRIPNLLFFPLWAFTSYQLASLLKDRLNAVIFFISMMTISGLIEFFAHTRGYGMSMALMITSIWMAVRFGKNTSSLTLLYTLGIGVLACLANLTLIIFFSGLIAYLSVIIFMKSGLKRESLRAFIIIGLLGIIPTIAFAYFLFRMKSAGMLYYGFDTPVQSLEAFRNLIFGKQWSFAATVFGLAIFLFLFVFNLGKIFRDKFHAGNPQQLFSILLFICLTSILFLGIVMDIQYPEDRTGMYFIPLILGSVFFCIDELGAKLKYVSLVFLVFPFLFLIKANTDHSIIWDKTSPAESFVQRLQEEPVNNSPATIGGHNLSMLAWGYNNYRSGGELNQLQTSGFPGTIADYQLANLIQIKDVGHLYELLELDPISGIGLWKRKPMLQRIETDSGSFTSSGITNIDSLSLYSTDIESINSQALVVDFDAILSSPEKPFTGEIHCKIWDAGGKVCKHERIYLHWKQNSWDAAPLKASIFFSELPENASHLKCYLLNPHREQFNLSGKLHLNALSQ